jgi:hypothetical protein
MGLVVEKNIQVAMRDGVALATDVYRPDSGGPFPVVLQRLPYDKEFTGLVNMSFDVLRGAQAGYAVVVQDTRGRYASEGEFNPFFDEAKDGADTVAWAAAQPWSTGQVGMVGSSYFGATQWLAASEAPAALKAIAPFVTTDQYYESWSYQGGAYQLGFTLTWTLLTLALGEMTRRTAAGAAKAEDFAALVAAVDATDELLKRTPLRDVPELEGLAPYYNDWLDHPSYDDFWKACSPAERRSEINVPSLNMGGWFDLFLKGTIANYLAMKEQGAQPGRDAQRLVIGPWAHGPMGGWFPERSFGLMGSADAADITGMTLRWFDHLLKGEDNGVPGDKPVRVFVMGANTWREEDDWPLPDTDFVDYHLGGAGLANTATGDGTLGVAAPDGQATDVYLYDPRNPVPTVGGSSFLPGLFIGANAGPRDQREVEQRADVLCYTSEPLDSPLEVTGPVEAILYVSSSAPDTDFTAKLVDVAPDGRAENLADGILRVRYRESLSEPVLMEPGEIYEIRVDLVAISNVFAAGHRIRLDVSSSNFPRFDRNTNTGGVIAREGAEDFQTAVNRVHHGGEHRSRLVLPVIRR